MTPRRPRRISRAVAGSWRCGVGTDAAAGTSIALRAAAAAAAASDSQRCRRRRRAASSRRCTRSTRTGPTTTSPCTAGGPARPSRLRARAGRAPCPAGSRGPQPRCGGGVPLCPRPSPLSRRHVQALRTPGKGGVGSGGPASPPKTRAVTRFTGPTRRCVSRSHGNRNPLKARMAAHNTGPGKWPPGGGVCQAEHGAHTQAEQRAHTQAEQRAHTQAEHGGGGRS